MPSIEKKRARDRRAQQSLRERKQKRIEDLEALVAECRENHQAQDTADASAREVAALRQQNRALLRRQELLKSLVTSWDDLDVNIPPQLQPTGGVVAPAGETQSVGATPATSHTEGAATTPPEPPSSDATLAWRNIPPSDDDFSNLEKVVGFQWFQDRSIIQDSPDTPSSPLDILYGSKVNPLAAMVHVTGKRRPFREPERLATGWLAYIFSRWILAPSPSTFAALPPFLRPVPEQLDSPHPLALNMVPWPKVRVALIHQWPLYRDNHRDLFDLLTCCVRVRWPWGESVLERADDNALVMRPEFFTAFTSEGGWTITRDFVDHYPGLFAGVNVDSILYKFL